MCGIVAFYSPGTASDVRADLLKNMTRAIKHRGPDHQGEWWDDTVPLGLAQRRLSIVDLTADGHQPMLSHTGRYVISFNGEIYNFRDLQNELSSRGVVFRGRSDTEVLLAAIETFGLNTACQKINGMFAIILWDRQRQELHLIRDRMGKKPLYFGFAGDDFVAGSELRVFMAHPQFKREISGTALAHYLHLGFVPAPHSMFAGVSMLLPGCRLVVKLDDLHAGADLRARMDPFWSPARVVEDARARPLHGTYDERLRETETVIEQATLRRMMADVPLGAFLSGGIDSSLIVALMQKNSTQAVKTYTIGFREQGYDESSAARAVASHLGTDHHEQILSTDDALAIIADLPRLCDEPLADVSFIPTYLVSRFARQSVTVALTGDGGDEVFGGYYRHTSMQKVLRLIQMTPRVAHPAITSFLSRLADLAYRGDPQGGVRLRKLTGLLRQSDLPAMYEFLAGQAEDNAITRAPRVLSGYPFRQSASWPTNLSLPEWMIFADTIHYLPGNVLTKVDRASMATSLEARAPLLDRAVFAHAWSLPLADKIKGGVGKRILRDLLARHVPPDLATRPKQGFAVPIADWLAGPLRSDLEGTLTSRRLVDGLGLSPDDLKALGAAHAAGQIYAPQTLWRLFVLDRWAREYL